MAHSAPILMTMLVLLSCSDWILAEEAADSSPSAVRVATLTPVSESFRRQTSLAMQTIPEHVWQVIQSAGWRIRLAEFVVDAQPDLVNDRPRGWPADATWRNSDAVHLPAERLLVLAEKRRNRGGQVVATERVAGVLRHELGHAFDMVTGGSSRFRSASDEFRIAYSADLQKMSAGIGKELAYYLQDSDAGRQEAFAEAFGIALGGGSDAIHDVLFRKSFPEVLALLRRDLRLESK